MTYTYFITKRTALHSKKPVSFVFIKKEYNSLIPQSGSAFLCTKEKYNINQKNGQEV